MIIIHFDTIGRRQRDFRPRNSSAVSFGTSYAILPNRGANDRFRPLRNFDAKKYVCKIRKRRKQRVIREIKKKKKNVRPRNETEDEGLFSLEGRTGISWLRQIEGHEDAQILAWKVLRRAADDTTLWVLVKNERKRVRKSIVGGRKADVATDGMVGNRGSRRR